MTKTSSAVRNISMKRPWAVVVPPVSVVFTFSGPGNSPDTTAAAHIPLMNWAMKTTRARMGLIAPMRRRARVTFVQMSVLDLGDVMSRLTAGLKRPPLIRKKAHALTAREKPNAREMYIKFDELGYCESELFSVAGAAALATCVAANAMNRNMKVPTNSPRKAMSSFLTMLGIQLRRLSRLSLGAGLEASCLLTGRTGFLKDFILMLGELRWMWRKRFEAQLQY